MNQTTESHQDSDQRLERARAPKRRARAVSKQAAIGRLLKRKSGATMAQLMEHTSWQAHSLRASLSRMRKSGVVIESETNKRGVRVYRIDRAEASS